MHAHLVFRLASPCQVFHHISLAASRSQLPHRQLQLRSRIVTDHFESSRVPPSTLLRQQRTSSKGLASTPCSSKYAVSSRWPKCAAAARAIFACWTQSLERAHILALCATTEKQRTNCKHVENSQCRGLARAIVSLPRSRRVQRLGSSSQATVHQI